MMQTYNEALLNLVLLKIFTLSKQLLEIIKFL